MIFQYLLKIVNMLINSFETKILKLTDSIYQYKLIIDQFKSITLLYMKDLNHVSLTFDYYNQTISKTSLELFIQSTFKFVSDIMSFDQYYNLVSDFYHNICGNLLLRKL